MLKERFNYGVINISELDKINEPTIEQRIAMLEIEINHLTAALKSVNNRLKNLEAQHV